MFGEFIPTEILCEILLLSSTKDCIIVSMACKRMQSIVWNDKFWFQKLHILDASQQIKSFNDAISNTTRLLQSPIMITHPNNWFDSMTETDLAMQFESFRIIINSSQNFNYAHFDGFTRTMQWYTFDTKKGIYITNNYTGEDDNGRCHKNANDQYDENDNDDRYDENDNDDRYDETDNDYDGRIYMDENIVSNDYVHHYCRKTYTDYVKYIDYVKQCGYQLKFYNPHGIKYLTFEFAQGLSSWYKQTDYIVIRGNDFGDGYDYVVINLLGKYIYSFTSYSNYLYMNKNIVYIEHKNIINIDLETLERKVIHRLQSKHTKNKHLRIRKNDGNIYFFDEIDDLNVMYQYNSILNETKRWVLENGIINEYFITADMIIIVYFKKILVYT